MTILVQKPLFTSDEITRLLRCTKGRRDPLIKTEILARLSKQSMHLATDSDKRRYLLNAISIAQLPNEKSAIFCLCLTTIFAIFITIWGVGPLLAILLSSVFFGLLLYLGCTPFPSLERSLLQNYVEVLREIEHSMARNMAKNARNDAKNAQRVDIERAQLRNEMEGLYQEMINKTKLIAVSFPAFQDLSNRYYSSILPNVTILPGQVPSNILEFEGIIYFLDLQRNRIKELAKVARLTSAPMQYYQDISRQFYGLHRPGGLAALYDEQAISNELFVLKESLVVNGDYRDESVHNHSSVNNYTSVAHTTNIKNALYETGEYDDDRIKKEILRRILSIADEAASRIDLLAAIPVAESRLLSVLEGLQLSGTIKIGNRSTGEIVYRLDRLA